MSHVAAAHAPDHHTSTGLDTFKLGFWVFLGSETLFFGSLISTYMVYKNESVVGPYTQEIFDIPLTSISTFVLLMSSFLFVLGLWGTQNLDRPLRVVGLSPKAWARIGILGTILLGATFIGFQSFEFTEFYHEGLTLQKSLFGSTFFVLTGFHGAHVSVGVIWLTILFLQLLRGRLGPRNALTLEIAGLYWHFVDIVWIAIFTLIYLIQ